VFAGGNLYPYFQVRGPPPREKIKDTCNRINLKQLN
jgi:hypothetical protein